jgi:hypothetical protein
MKRPKVKPKLLRVGQVFGFLERAAAWSKRKPYERGSQPTRPHSILVYKEI